MAYDDYVNPEVAVAVAVTAIVTSPKARQVVRRGAVYGLAALMMAADAVTQFARSAAQGVQELAERPRDAETPVRRARAGARS